MSKVSFFVQFHRVRGGSIEAQKLTKTRGTLPRGMGAVSVQFKAEIPDWVFDPLDLIAETVVPADAPEPLIRLEAVGPVLPDGEGGA
jgi:hypothetical protein